MDFPVASIALIIVSIFIASPLLAYWMHKWQWALLGCIVYIPISGYISIMLNRNPVALQAKDFFFLIPAYIGFALFLQSKIKFSGIPRGFTLAAISLVILVMIQTLNPNPKAPGILGSVLAIKIWTFYLPLIMITYIYVSTPANLIFLVRMVVISSWIPATVGLLQYALSRVYGFDKVMKFCYGDEARSVSFGFGELQTATGTLYRIPSTFTFISQYSYFLLAAFCFTLIAIEIERTRFWRILSYSTLVLLLAASVTSGSRFMLYVCPVALVSYFLIKRGIGAALLSSVVLFLMNSFASIVFGINPLSMAKEFSHLIEYYVFEWIPETLTLSVLRFPLGAGTGSATSQTRHLGSSFEKDLVHIEGYIAKAIVELGIPGLVIVLALLTIPIFVNFSNLFRSKDSTILAIVSSLFIYQSVVFFQSLKGNPLDQDPSNVFFWVSVGITFRINSYLQFQQSSARQPNYHRTPDNTPRQIPQTTPMADHSSQTSEQDEV